MNSETQILNWLKAGISQPPNSLTESFYYDKLTAEFFSIMFTDYFMFDEEMNIAKNTTTPYSEPTQNKLIDKIKRVEQQDQSILNVVRLTDTERKDLLRQFIGTVDNQNEKARLENTYLADKPSAFDVSFEIESDQTTVKKWEEFKDEALLAKAELFLNLNQINIQNAKVWIPEEESSITIDLTKDDEGNPIKTEK